MLHARAGALAIAATAALALAACGRLGFDAEGGDPGDARPWDGEFTLTEPVPVTELNSAGGDTECFVLPDGRTLLYTTTRSDGFGDHDVYSAQRSGPGAPFGAVAHLVEISTSDAEGHLATSDGLHGYFWSTRPGGLGSSDIWMVTRDDPASAFSSPHAENLTILNTAQNDYDPWPSADGRRLYYARAGDLVVAERATPEDAFGPPIPLAGPGIVTSSIEDNPALSADERFLVFSATRPEGLGERDIYYARRADRNAPFSEPRLLPLVNGPYKDWEACITEGGELFFSSDRPGGMGSDDIYRSQFVPLP
jgi:WD40-like Beta Propeller Repeat